MREIDIEILRTGSFRDANHKEYAFPEARLDEIADSYDPKNGAAPLVFGHPKMNGPAYGWVKALRRTGPKLIATVERVPKAVRELIRQGTYRKVSASLFQPASTSTPAPGKFYLRHIGLLGGTAPAIPGLADIELAGNDEETFTVEFSATEDEKPATDPELEGVLSKLIDTLSSFTSSDDIKALLPESVRARHYDGSGEKIDAAEFSAAYDAVSGALSSRLQRADELEELTADFADRRRRDENDAAVKEAFNEGRLPGYLMPRVTEILNAMDDAETVDFAESDALDAESSTLAAQFRNVLRLMPKYIEFAELSAPDHNDTDLLQSGRSSQITAHIDKAKAEGRTLSATDASVELGFLT